MNGKIVLNTSSSLFFAKMGLIPHILKEFKIITTEEILKEIKDGDQIGFKDAKIILQYIEDKKIEIIKTKKINDITKEFKIKDEDASVISLAEEQNCFLATEERQIERICMLKQIKITNTVLIIYYLWQKKEFNKDQAYLLLDLLLRNGYNNSACSKIKEKIGAN